MDICLWPLLCSQLIWVIVLIEEVEDVEEEGKNEQNNQLTDSYSPIRSSKLKLVENENESKSHCTIIIMSHYLEM